MIPTAWRRRSACWETRCVDLMVNAYWEALRFEIPAVGEAGEAVATGRGHIPGFPGRYL